MNITEINDAIGDCQMPGYNIEVTQSPRGELYIQANYWEQDTVSGVQALQHTRKWLLSPQMTKSEVIQTVFKCILTSMEHKTREWFKYRGKAIFGPHYSVDALYEICGKQGSHDAR